MPENVLELRHVTRIFGRGTAQVRALDGVSLAVVEGRSLGIVGESGAGKSTVLNLMLGLDRPSSGQVLWHGQLLPVADRRRMRELRRHAQMVFQDPRSSLDPRMTVGRIIAEPLRSLRLDGDHAARVREVLQWVGLEPDMISRYPAQFSGGQRQRIAIARALAPRPRLLIADEPVSALDVSVKAELMELLARLQRDLGLTLLMVSHDIAVVGQLCQDVVVMSHGRVIEAGPTHHVLPHPASAYTRALLAAIPRLPAAAPTATNTPIPPHPKEQL